MKPFAAVLAILALVFGLAILFHSGGDGNKVPSLAEMESDLVCLTCHEPLDESNSLFAQQMKAQLRQQISAGWTKDRIEHYYVVTEGFGPAVLAVPEQHGFDLLAWLLPLGVLAFGGGAVGIGARAWLRDRDGPDTVAALPVTPSLAPGLDARVDAELARFDG
jgi:cytochrome c-type biogenesis protein CcmH/NrfF